MAEITKLGVVLVATVEKAIIQTPLGGGNVKIVLHIKNVGVNPLTELRMEARSLDGGQYIPIIGSTPVDDWAGFAMSSLKIITRTAVFIGTPAVITATPMGSLAAGETGVVELDLHSYQNISLVATSALGTSVDVSFSFKGY